jgi:hypothetical protein
MKPYMDDSAKHRYFRVKLEKLDIWSESTEGCQEAVSDDSRKSKDYSVSTEELCG